MNYKYRVPGKKPGVVVPAHFILQRLARQNIEKMKNIVALSRFQPVKRTQTGKDKIISNMPQMLCRSYGLTAVQQYQTTRSIVFSA